MSRVLFHHQPVQPAVGRRPRRRRPRRTPGDHVLALILWCGAGLVVWLAALWLLALALGWR